MATGQALHSAAVPRQAAGCGLREAEKSFIPNTKVNIALVEEMVGRRGRRAFFLSGECTKAKRKMELRSTYWCWLSLTRPWLTQQGNGGQKLENHQFNPAGWVNMFCTIRSESFESFFLAQVFSLS